MQRLLFQLLRRQHGGVLVPHHVQHQLLLPHWLLLCVPVSMASSSQPLPYFSFADTGTTTCTVGTCLAGLAEKAHKVAGFLNATHASDGTPLPAEALRRFQQRRALVESKKAAIAASGKADKLDPQLCQLCPVKDMENFDLSADGDMVCLAFCSLFIGAQPSVCCFAAQYVQCGCGCTYETWKERCQSSCTYYTCEHHSFFGACLGLSCAQLGVCCRR